MSVRKIRKSWWVDFRAEGVRYRKRSPLNTKAGAKDYEATLRCRIERGYTIKTNILVGETFNPVIK
jgi:hypothetical protein